LTSTYKRFHIQIVRLANKFCVCILRQEYALMSIVRHLGEPLGECCRLVNLVKHHFLTCWSLNHFPVSEEDFTLIKHVENCRICLNERSIYWINWNWGYLANSDFCL